MTDQPEVTEEELQEIGDWLQTEPYAPILYIQKAADTVRSLRAQQAALVEALEVALKSRCDNGSCSSCDYFTDPWYGATQPSDEELKAAHAAPSSLPAAAKAHQERDAVFVDIMVERERQDAKYQPSTVRNTTVPNAQKVSVLSEELGEVARAANAEAFGAHPEQGHDLHSELVQLGALVIGWLQALADPALGGAE